MRSLGFLIVFLLLWVVPTGAQTPTKLPHYFPEGIEKTNDIVSQMEATDRYLNNNCQTGVHGARVFEKSVHIERTIEGKKVVFIFDAWVPLAGDKEFAYWNACGETKVTRAQFDIVADDFIKSSIEAMNEVFDYYKDLDQWAIEARAERLKMSVADLRALLDKPTPESPAITYRELFQLPDKMKKSDCIAKEVHLGYLPIGILGATWLNTGVVYITPVARIMDYMIGKPAVMIHEFVHANPTLQRMPLSQGFDVELFASIPSMFFPEDQLRLLSHSYVATIRELMWVYFGFNTEQVRDDVIMFDNAGNLRIDGEKLKKYGVQLEKIKRELLIFWPKVIGEFYSDPVFWTSMNHRLGDQQSVVVLIFARYYEPTILGGYEETTKFLKSHEDEIKKMANQAWIESDPNTQKTEEKTVPAGISPAMLEELKKFSKLDEKELLRLATKYGITLDDIKDKSTTQILQLFMTIMEKEHKEVAP